MNTYTTHTIITHHIHCTIFLEIFAYNLVDCLMYFFIKPPLYMMKAWGRRGEGVCVCVWAGGIGFTIVLS